MFLYLYAALSLFILNIISRNLKKKKNEKIFLFLFFILNLFLNSGLKKILYQLFSCIFMFMLFYVFCLVFLFFQNFNHDCNLLKANTKNVLTAYCIYNIHKQDTILFTIGLCFITNKIQLPYIYTVVYIDMHSKSIFLMWRILKIGYRFYKEPIFKNPPQTFNAKFIMLHNKFIN